ncbi:MAG TPA: sigma-70 family RNA polymerase sigma factor, partial [Acidimicrobiales bacterium]|nr:sigma-70 family RNA polymerase sigma factor [Acidimicrobiales bacterium]
DAFQATFLILDRKAGSLRDRQRLGPWLYGVAHRVARRARSQSAHRRTRERPEAVEMAVESDPGRDLERRERLAALEEEVARLPEKPRAALVLCDLEGRTYEEAARQLDCPLGTLKSRLASARDRLRRRLVRRRLVRRGLAPATAALATGHAARAATAAVPATLARTTLEAAMRCLAGRGAAGAGPASVSATVSILTEGVLTTMFLSRLRTILAVLLALGAGAAGLVALAQTQPQAPATPATRYDDMIRDLEERLKIMKRMRDTELVRMESRERAAAHLVKLGGRVERDVVSVNLVATSVTNNDLKLLSFFPHLQVLHLHHNAIGDAGVANLQGLENLTTLDLFDTRITDASLVHLAEWMPFLQELELSDTKVTDAGLLHLKGLKHLRRLDVRKTTITEAGV